MMKVSSLAWSAEREGTLFAVFDGHKDNLFSPFVVRTDDFGATWQNVTGDLPSFGPTRSVAVHPRNGNLAFVGTEFGAFFTNRGGEKWTPLPGLPTVAVHAMVVHPRDNDLVLGTHGRGFWVLDDLGLLDALDPQAVASHSLLATPREATQIRDTNRGRGSVGDTYWTAANPPRGAILDYWIGDEARGEAVTLEVLDAAGNLVRKVAEATGARGAHRAVWDLRHSPPLGADGLPSRRFRGRFVLPGSYDVRLTVGTRVHTRPLRVRMDPALSVDQETRVALDSTLELQARLLGATAMAGAAVDTVLAQAETALQALEGRGDAPEELTGEAQDLHARAQALQLLLHGPGQTGVAQQETALPLSSVTSRLYSSTEAWTGPPTEDQLQFTNQAHQEMVDLLATLRLLLENDLPGLRQGMTEAGIPWPAGEVPNLPENLLPPVIS
jgi:hypothetical protein